jgi:CRISPR system Cascade subunit CasC
MYVECHILQNFAPSNLNRDDAGNPKDVTFGGFRRGRISSQCLKRAVRMEFARDGSLPPDLLGTRTKRLVSEIARRLVVAGRPPDSAAAVAAAAVASAGFTLVGEQKTQYLLYLGQAEIEELARLCETHWEPLLAASAPDSTEAAAPSGATKKGKRGSKPSAVPPGIAKEIAGFLRNGGRSVDVALLGRMLADLPGQNVDGACQVAHALSTNRMEVDFDYYTAVDDLKPDDSAGADMIGVVEMDSGCFYRYSNVNVRELTANLGGDLEVSRRALDAYLRATIAAVPSGKQHSTAAQNPPSLILCVVREKGLWSLVNAFVDPIAPGAEGDLVARSIRALDRYWGSLVTMYGEAGVGAKYLCALGEAPLAHLEAARVPNVDDLVRRAVESAFPSA